MAEEKKRKHLHKVELEDTHDGHILEHHTYKPTRHSPDHEAEPQKKNVAVHATPEEAGQAATEALGQNAPPDPNADPGAAAPPGGGDPGGAAPGMAQ